MGTLTQGEAFSLARRVVGRRAEREANEERTQRLLDEDVATMLDELQDAIVGPVIDRQHLEAWEESRARDFDVTDEIPY